MTNQIKNFIEEENKRICNEIRNNHNKWGFKIAQDLAGQGSLGVYEDDKKIISSFQISLIKMVMEMVESEKKDGSDETRNRIEKDGYGYLYERLIGHNIALDTISSKLKEVIKE